MNDDTDASGRAVANPGRREGAKDDGPRRRNGPRTGQDAGSNTGPKKGRKGKRGNKAGGGEGGQRALVPMPDAQLPDTKSARPEPAAPVQALATPARMKRRHWGLLTSFLLLVVGPTAGIIFYLWSYAADQYGSTTGFTVRQEESGGASELLGGLAGFASGSTASDGDILYEFIQSQEMVEAVDAQVDLRAHYSK